MPGFQHAGGHAPIKVRYHVGETIYQGCLAMSNLVGGTGGHVQLADAASEAHENDQPILGIVTGTVDESRAYSSTYYGDGSTYTTTQGTVASTRVPEVEVLRIIPGLTQIKGPIFYTAYGTAPTVLDITTASAGGTAITHANDTITDTADDLGTVYCRTGANAGQIGGRNSHAYRVITTGTTTAQTVTVPYAYATAVGDTFVKAACVLGLGGIDILATANCINGDSALSAYYDVVGHELNCEESGKEYFIFSFCAKACGPVAA